MDPTPKLDEEERATEVAIQEAARHLLEKEAGEATVGAAIADLTTPSSGDSSPLPAAVDRPLPERPPQGGRRAPRRSRPFKPATVREEEDEEEPPSSGAHTQPPLVASPGPTPVGPARTGPRLIDWDESSGPPNVVISNRGPWRSPFGPCPPCPAVSCPTVQPCMSPPPCFCAPAGPAPPPAINCPAADKVPSGTAVAIGALGSLVAILLVAAISGLYR